MYKRVIITQVANGYIVDVQREVEGNDQWDDHYTHEQFIAANLVAVNELVTSALT